jgi:CTP synthase (UTP-ammonia lyase)
VAGGGPAVCSGHDRAAPAARRVPVRERSLVGRSPVEQLSDRELEVFEMLGQGRGTRQIAEALRVSVKTVQAYCARMKEKLDLICLKKLNITEYKEAELTKWKEFLEKLRHPKSKVTIGLIGKYIELQDAYKSILESFVHAGAMNECKVQIVNVHSEFITAENVAEKLSNLDGLLVAPGFGHRGIEGKIIAVKYARENRLPFFGICLGMQMAVRLPSVITIQNRKQGKR